VKAFRFHCTHAYAGWLVAVVVTLSSLAAACHGGPVLDLGPKPEQADGTISGIIRGPEGTSAVEGRSVAVINVDTGEMQRTTTNNTGGFTFKVKPGKYRVELTILDGETIIKQPGVIRVNRSDVDAHADFVVGVVRISRPRNHIPRADDGLGSAIG
jgi:hypothetical protein